MTREALCCKQALLNGSTCANERHKWVPVIDKTAHDGLLGWNSHEIGWNAPRRRVALVLEAESTSTKCFQSGNSDAWRAYFLPLPQTQWSPQIVLPQCIIRIAYTNASTDSGHLRRVEHSMQYTSEARSQAMSLSIIDNHNLRNETS